MSVIIEGGDHVGKTTVAKMLEMGSGLPLIHAGIKGDDYDHVYDRMSDLSIVPSIYDRFHLSAFVYGRLLGLHPQNLTDEAFIELVQWIKDQGVNTVIMYASDHEDLERRMRLEKDKFEAFDLGIRLKANAHYQDLALNGFNGVAVCDITWDISTFGFPRMDQVAAWLPINPPID